MEEYQVLGVGVFPITSFMKSVINRSRLSATMVALSSCCTEEALVYVAEKCPDLRNLELPYYLGMELMRKFPNLISKWKDLEHLTLQGSFMIPIRAEISIHCKNFYSLTCKRAGIGKDQASAIVTLLPKKRYLDLNYVDIDPENVLKVLRGCKELVYFNVSTCFNCKGEDEMLKLGSRIRISTFKYFMVDHNAIGFWD